MPLKFNKKVRSEFSQKSFHLNVIEEQLNRIFIPDNFSWNYGDLEEIITLRSKINLELIDEEEILKKYVEEEVDGEEEEDELTLHWK